MPQREQMKGIRKKVNVVEKILSVEVVPQAVWGKKKIHRGGVHQGGPGECVAPVLVRVVAVVGPCMWIFKSQKSEVRTQNPE